MPLAESVLMVLSYVLEPEFLNSLFCDLTQPKRFAEEGDFYLVRYHPKVRFYRDERRAVRTGTDAEGRSYHEEWGWLGSPKKPAERLYVRRIHLLRPDDEAVILVTNLLDADMHPAGDLLRTSFG